MKSLVPFASSTCRLLLASAGLLALSSATQAAVLLGHSYTPTGANYTMTAAQGIDAASPLGKSSFSPQVNRDFEFDQTFGVAYDKGGGSVTQFGLGLYADAAKQTQSTGLNIQFNGLVSASTVSIVLADFDIKATDAFFNPNKVEPGLILLGANNSIFANATPENIFAAMVPTTVPGASSKEDYWKLDFGKLLQQLGKSDANIQGFLLYADASHGEKPNSDPYFLMSVGGGIPMIPEPSTYLGGIALIALLLGTHARAVVKASRAESQLS